MDNIENYQVKVGNYKTESKQKKYIKQHKAVKNAFHANN